MPSGDHGVALSLIRHNSVMAAVRRGDARWRLVGRDCLDPSSRKGRVCCTHGFLTVGPISSITVLLVIWRAWRLGSLGSADLFWWVGQPGWSVAFGLGVNKGSGSRVPLVTRQRSTSCLSSLILARVSCSGGSAGELPWACYAWSLLDSVGFGRARPFFFRPVGSWESDAELCYLLPWHVWLYGEVRGGERRGSRDWRTSNGVLRICVDEELDWTL
jgi:hypothetical protein